MQIHRQALRCGAYAVLAFMLVVATLGVAHLLEGLTTPVPHALLDAHAQVAGGFTDAAPVDGLRDALLHAQDPHPFAVWELAAWA
jgi:hypothetical protein